MVMLTNSSCQVKLPIPVRDQNIKKVQKGQGNQGDACYHLRRKRNDLIAANKCILLDL